MNLHLLGKKLNPYSHYQSDFATFLSLTSRARRDQGKLRRQKVAKNPLPNAY